MRFWQLYEFDMIFVDVDLDLESHRITPGTVLIIGCGNTTLKQVGDGKKSKVRKNEDGG